MSHPGQTDYDIRPDWTTLQSLAPEKLRAQPIAKAENTGRPMADRSVRAYSGELDPKLVKESYAHLMAAGLDAMEYFYARLFTVSPDIRALFPTSMIAQRERAFASLGRLVSSLDNPPGCEEMLGRLAREHRRFGVTDRHYPAFFAALLDTAEHYIGRDWTAETASAWRVAINYISSTMKAAAAADARIAPPWWIAEIVSHELRSPGVAVIRLRPSLPLPYQAGQYVPVQVTKWPRVWRPYSLAAAPRPNGLLELHVKAVPGGMVSNTLVHHSDVGDNVLLGAAEGGMTLTDSDRDLLCVAGGTGLAPLKAIIEQALAAPRRGRSRKITLFVGARQHFDLYDLEDLQLLESLCPSLRVLPVLSDQPGYGGLTGLLADVVSGRAELFENCETYICGPAQMVSRAAALLSAGVPASQLHHDPLL
jgi:NAD(P)H-flavin reductase/hemoglobin-like flavoprotein